MSTQKKGFKILLANRASAKQILLAQQEIHWPKSSGPVLIYVHIWQHRCTCMMTIKELPNLLSMLPQEAYNVCFPWTLLMW